MYLKSYKKKKRQTWEFCHALHRLVIEEQGWVHGNWMNATKEGVQLFNGQFWLRLWGQGGNQQQQLLRKCPACWTAVLTAVDQRGGGGGKRPQLRLLLQLSLLLFPFTISFHYKATLIFCFNPECLESCFKVTHFYLMQPANGVGGSAARGDVSRLRTCWKSKTSQEWGRAKHSQSVMTYLELYSMWKPNQRETQFERVASIKLHRRFSFSEVKDSKE